MSFVSQVDDVLETVVSIAKYGGGEGAGRTLFYVHITSDLSRLSLSLKVVL